MMDSILFFIMIFILFVGCKQVKPKWRSWKTSKLPPGPKGLPIVGNLFQFWHARDSGSMNSYLLSLRDFGEMTTMHMGSHLWVIINTDRVATDIISKKSTITSERPHMPISSGLVSNNRRSVIQHSATWNKARRLMRPLLTSSMITKFTEWQDVESMQMLLSYLQEPEKWYLHQSRYATAVLYGVITGDCLTKTEEQLAEYRQVTMEFLGSLFSSVVDFFPILEYVPRPLQWWRAEWELVGRSHYHVFKKWWDPLAAKVANGSAQASWVRDIVLNPEMGFKNGAEEALYLTNSVISAGGDNTRMTLNVSVMASIHFPEQIYKCRQEIDSICGSNAQRMPTLTDTSSMPYLCAFIKEIMRWRPIVPLIPPHQSTQEFEYEGFVFPKYTNFIINTVAICADCDQPEAFRPERWLNGNETNLTHGFWGFGGGRRICIGYKATQPALFIALSRLIYCFDFKPRGHYDSTLLNQWSSTEPFPVETKIRSPEHECLILKEGAARGLRKSTGVDKDLRDEEHIGYARSESHNG